MEEEQTTKEEVDAKAAVARILQEEEEELERLIREMEDTEAKRLAKQAAEKAAANKFAADNRTYLDQLCAMEGKYGKHLYDNKTHSKKELEDLHTQIRKHEIELSYTNREHEKELFANKSTTGRRPRISRLNLWGVPVFP